MEDRVIMDNLLTSTKEACGLMKNGTIESSTANVHNTFKTALDDCLCMQNQIYTKMAAKGWYPTQQVEQQKIDAVKQKFAGQ